MAHRLQITRPISIPGGVNAPASVLAPSLSVGGTLSPDVVNAPASVLAPTLRISITLTPDVVNAPASVLAPTLRVSVTLTPSPINAPANLLPGSLKIGGAITPAVVNAPADVLAPSLLIQKAITATTVNAPASVLAATLVFTKVFQPNAINAPASVPTHSIIIGEDILLQPLPINAPATVNIPTLIGDFYVHVVDPPWNVTNILQTRFANKQTYPKERLPHLIGILLYDWWNDIYNGAAYNLTGGTIIDVYDGDIVDADMMFDAVYTVVTRNPGTTISTDIDVINFIREWEMDCLDTDLDTASRILAALLHVDSLGTLNPCGVTWTRLGAGSVTLDRLGAGSVSWGGCGT